VIHHVIVALSVSLSFINEYRAQIAVETLHASIHHRSVGVAKPARQRDVEGEPELIPARGSLRSGVIVPADIPLDRGQSARSRQSRAHRRIDASTKCDRPIPSLLEPISPGAPYMGNDRFHEDRGGRRVQTGTATLGKRLAAGPERTATTRHGVRGGPSNFFEFPSASPSPLTPHLSL